MKAVVMEKSVCKEKVLLSCIEDTDRWCKDSEIFIVYEIELGFCMTYPKSFSKDRLTAPELRAIASKIDKYNRENEDG